MYSLYRVSFFTDYVAFQTPSENGNEISMVLGSKNLQ